MAGAYGAIDRGIAYKKMARGEGKKAPAIMHSKNELSPHSKPTKLTNHNLRYWELFINPFSFGLQVMFHCDSCDIFTLQRYCSAISS